MNETANPTEAAAVIHDAELASGATGAVLYGAVIDWEAAVRRRRAGMDVVVRGDDADGNRRLARSIEEAIGPAKRGEPHAHAGSAALPHYQPVTRPPQGHTFYETTRRKARRMR